MKRVIIQSIGIIATFLCHMSILQGSQGPQFRVTQKDGRGYVEMVSSGSSMSQAESKATTAYEPNTKGLEKWHADAEALSSKVVDKKALDKKRQAELEAEVERQSRLAREQKKNAKREERWYTLTPGILKVKISGGSGNYRYILSKSKDLLQDKTEDTIQDGNPIFKNVTAGYHTIRVIDNVTKCEASSDFAVTRETMEISVAQFKPLPARC